LSMPTAGSFIHDGELFSPRWMAQGKTKKKQCRNMALLINALSASASSFFPSHEDREVDQTVRVAPFVVIPAYQFHEVVIESNASTNIKDR